MQRAVTILQRDLCCTAHRYRHALGAPSPPPPPALPALLPRLRLLALLPPPPPPAPAPRRGRVALAPGAARGATLGDWDAREGGNVEVVERLDMDCVRELLLASTR